MTRTPAWVGQEKQVEVSKEVREIIGQVNDIDRVFVGHYNNFGFFSEMR